MTEYKSKVERITAAMVTAPHCDGCARPQDSWPGSDMLRTVNERDEAEAIIEDMLARAQTMATSGAKNSAKVVLETFQKAIASVKKKRSGS